MGLTKNQLTREQVIRAGSVSKKDAVRKAYKKLEFALELAHTKDEIEDLADTAIYQLRIAHRLEDGTEYENIMIRWSDNEFIVYAPRNGGTITGEGNTLDKDPAVVYLKTPLSVTDAITQNIKEAAMTMHRKIGRRK